MKKARLFLLVLLIPALFQVSCKKDEEPGPTGPEYKAPAAAAMTEIVTIPAGLQAKADEGTDFGAVMAVTYMGLANALSGFASMFTVPDNAQLENKKDGSSVYYWTYGGYSYWMTYSELADKNTWRYEYQLPEYPRFTFILAEEAKNGKDGNWTIYDPEEVTHNEIWTYDWSISTINTFTANMVMFDGDAESLSFDVVSLANHSGSFQVHDATVLSAEILWNIDGSGTYWIAGDGEGLAGSWTAK
jgi:hypothetical protein